MLNRASSTFLAFFLVSTGYAGTPLKSVVVASPQFGSMNPSAGDIRTLAAREGNGGRGGGDVHLGDQLRHLGELPSAKAGLRNKILTLAFARDGGRGTELERRFVASRPLETLERETIIVLPSCRDSEGASSELVISASEAVSCVSAPVFLGQDSARTVVLSTLLGRLATVDGSFAAEADKLFDSVLDLKIAPLFGTGGFPAEAARTFLLAPETDVTSQVPSNVPCTYQVVSLETEPLSKLLTLVHPERPLQNVHFSIRMRRDADGALPFALEMTTDPIPGLTSGDRSVTYGICEAP